MPWTLTLISAQNDNPMYRFSRAAEKEDAYREAEYYLTDTLGYCPEWMPATEPDGRPYYVNGDGGKVCYVELEEIDNCPYFLPPSPPYFS